MFKDNLEYINKHNEEAAQGKHTFTLGVNKFADITHTEWQKSMNVRKTVKDRPLAPMTMRSVNRAAEVDWREQVSIFTIFSIHFQQYVKIDKYKNHYENH